MNELNVSLLAVSRAFDIDPAQIIKKGRRRDLVKSRQTLAYILSVVYKIGPLKIEQLAMKSEIASFDHANVLHAKKTIENILETNDILYSERVENSIKLAKLISETNISSDEEIDNMYNLIIPPGEMRRLRISINSNN